MSTLSVSQVQNTASPVSNIVLNANGSSTLALYRTTGVAPTPVQIGTLWYDVSGAGLVIWDGSAWVGVGGGSGTVTGVTASLPLVSSGGATPNLTLNLGLGTAVNGSNIAVSIPVASTAPAAGTGAAQALNGSLYWDDGVGSLFIRYNNGGTPTWVQASGSSNVITTNATYYVATTGNDTTGNGSAATPWATPHKAMEYLSAFVIKQGVTVTVSVANGTYTFTTPLNLNHPNGSQIFINGGTTTGSRPTTTLTGGNAVGNTGATLAANDALLNAYYNTKWQFNGCHGLVCQTGGGVTVNTVLIRGNAVSPWVGVLTGNIAGSVGYASAGTINLGSTVAVNNFGYCGVLVNQGGSILASDVTVTNSGNTNLGVVDGGSVLANNAISANSGGNGIGVVYGGSIIVSGATARYNSGNGIITSFGGSINAASATASNNGGNGIITENGGSINATSATASNNAGNGIVTSAGGSVLAASATASSNVGNGIYTSFGGSINAQSATASSNGSSGITTYFGGSIVADSATASNNVLNGLLVNYGGSIGALGATALTNGSTNVLAFGWGGIYFTGGNAAGSLSPAANTIGNGTAYIAV